MQTKPKQERTPQPKAVLFDLDGTLLDSAPDLVEAMNQVLDARGLTRMALAKLRPMAGAGARGMIGLAMGLQPNDSEYQEVAEDFFSCYLLLNNQLSSAFAGVLSLLEELDAREIPWGIVTNKASRFTDPAVRVHLFLQHARTIISGDTTPFSKPHPEPLFEAARRMGVEPRDCCYVGDDKRDMEAAQAAGMVSVAASWGYIGEFPIASWGADFEISKPEDLLGLWD